MFLHLVRSRVVRDVFEPGSGAGQIVMPDTKLDWQPYVRAVFNSLYVDSFHGSTKQEVITAVGPWRRDFRSRLLRELPIEVSEVSKIHSDFLDRLLANFCTNIHVHLVRGLGSYLSRFLLEYFDEIKEMKQAQATACYMLRTIQWWGKVAATSMVDKPYVYVSALFFFSLRCLRITEHTRYIPHVNNDVVAEFSSSGGVIIRDDNTNQDLDMTLPGSANEAFKYLAKLSLCNSRNVKLVPLTTLQRKFIQCDRRTVQHGALGDEYRNITSLSEVFRSSVSDSDVTGSNEVALWCSSRDKESFRFDGHSGHFGVHKRYV